MRTRHLLTTLGCILLAMIALVTLTSCEVSVDAATNLADGYSRNSTETGEITEEFKTAMANFSMTLFKNTLTKDDKNDLNSSLSAMMCLAMIANGANGDTKTQMENVLGMDIDSLNKALYAYNSSFYRADNCKLNLANSIWFRDDEAAINVEKDFLQTNANWYDAQIYKAAFDHSTIKVINNWVKENTEGMIDEIINSIDDDTIMYLINALAFDAEWAVKYVDNDVIDYTFTNYDQKEHQVTMLSSQENTYIQSDEVVGFKKNYAGDTYSFVALLPNEDIDIYDYINSLDGEKWLNLWASQSTEKVYVKMPEFTYDCSMILSPILKSLGMTDMFDGNKADFSKLGRSKRGNIYVSDVCQKTYIKVDRNGTKAAAVTWGEMKNTTTVYFVYAIVDNATGLPLFTGAVTYLE